MNISNFRLATIFFVALFFHNLTYAQCNPDVTAPIAVCDAIVSVALSADGTATIPAETFDDGSFDMCCLDNLSIKRIDNACPDNQTDLEYGPDVSFCCNDVSSNPNFVVLRVTDCSANFNECFIEVIIEDKLAPITVSCPLGITTTCEFFNDNLSGLDGDALAEVLGQNFGTPEFYDNCVVNIDAEVMINQPNACNNFFIERTWTAYDGVAGGSQIYTGSGFALVASNANGQVGTNICIDISVYDFTDIVSMQFSMNFDPTVLEFSGYENLNLPDLTLGSFGSSSIPNGNLTISWLDQNVSGISVADETVIFQACFDVIGDTGNETDFEFSDNPTLIEVANSDEEILNLSLINGTIGVGNSSNGSVTCSQTIEVFFDNVWDVEFPEDVTVTCYAGGGFDAGTPVVSNNSCALTAMTYEDVVLTVATGDLCLKILRTWTIINWCDGSVQTQTQVIRIMNQGALTLTCPENIIVFSNPTNQLATVTLPLPDADDCSVLPTITATSSLPNFNPITLSATDVPEGNYVVTYTATDLCGNAAACDAIILVEQLEDDCPSDMTIDCDFYSSNLAPTLSQLAGDAEAQSQFLDQFFGEPSFDAGQNITTEVDINLDQCGNGTITRTWSLGDMPPPVDGFTLIASNETANSGDEICIGISGNDFTDILSMQFSMHFDPDVLQFESVGGLNLNDLLSSNFGLLDVDNGNLVLSWFDQDLQGVTLEDGEEIFEICFTVIGENGTNSAISFDGNPTIIEVIDVNGNEVNFNSMTGSVLVGDGNPPTGGCLIFSASDAVVEQGDEICVDFSVQNFNDILSFQYSMNFDENVLEFSQIQNLNLQDLTNGNFGIVDSGNGNLVVAWFDNTNATGVTIPNGTTIYQVCFNVIGEVGNMSVIQFSSSPTITEVIDGEGEAVCYEQSPGLITIGDNPPSGDCLIMSASNEMADVGDQVCVDISVQNFDDILSMQYSMDFDETVLEFVDVQNLNMQDLTNSNFGANNVENGTHVFAWFDNTNASGVTIADGTIIYQICFNVIGELGETSPITFSSSFAPIEAINGNTEAVCFEQSTGSVIVTENSPEGLVVTTTSQILCTQTITVNHVSDFIVEFPADVTVECSSSSLNAGEVELFAETCELVAVTYNDEVYTDIPGVCYKVVREYTVINWCVVGDDIDDEVIEIPESQLAAPYNDLDGDGDSDDRTFRDSWNGISFPVAADAGVDGAPDTDLDNNPWDGYITYTQNIFVDDTAAPVFVDNCEPSTVCLVSLFECIGTVTIPEPTVLDCAPNVDITVVSDLGAGFGPFADVVPGIYGVTYTATDVCGNVIVCESTFEVVDCTPPVAICDETTNVSLDSNGGATIFAETLDDGSYDNCSDVSFSFLTGNTMDFACGDLGSNFVQMNVTDAASNTNYCVTEIIVVDNLDVCPVDPCDDLPPNVALVCNDFVQVSLSPTGADFEFDYILEGILSQCLDNYNLSFSSTELIETLHFDCDDIGEQLVVVTDLDSGNLCWGTVSIEDVLGVCDGDPTDCTNDIYPPTPYCVNGLVVELMNTTPSFVQIWASDFDAGSFDNCSNVTVSFSSDPTNHSVIFDCGDLGTQPIQIWATDEAGNQDFCETYIIIQDNLDLCGANDNCDNDTEAPVVFCANGLVISIPTSGELVLDADVFDIGSLDNCTDQDDLQLSIELVDNNGNTIVPSSSSITFTSEDIGANNIILYVIDEAGNVSECSTIFLLQSNPPKFITGKIFIDNNDDCEYNAGEQGLDTWSVKLELIDDPAATEPGIVLLPTSYTIDSEGNYTITLPDNFEFFTLDSSIVTVNNLTAFLRLSLATTFNYGQTCPYNYFINAATNVLETIEIDFPVQIIEECPQLAVDISTPFLRRCFDNNYYVQYCNYGNEDVDGAFIEVEFDEFLEVNSSSLPWSAVNNHVYTFVLGTVPAAECGTFVINTTVSCDAELGQSHCVDARIFPDVVCTEENQNYVGPNIEITATCNGEEVEFTIKNNGEENMDDDIQYIIIEDFVMYNTNPLSLKLDSGESEIVVVPNNSSTWRLQTEQIPNHPVGGTPSYTIEGCSQTGEFSLGFVNLFPPDDNSPVISISCMENVGSFDPNDKFAIPTGYGDEHFIEANTDLEYIIRFQNTGTDTAFNIVIMDTLSQHLDPLSVRAGASSHPYDFTILGDNVLKFNFDNIMLPDSNINEFLSHGYISFRVSQYEDVALGTIIENDAAIYFDFNEPIITNTTFHTIGEHFIEMPGNSTVVFVPNVEVNIYPNPFRADATVEISGMNVSAGTLKVYDMTGKLVKVLNFEENKFQMNVEELPSSMYFYQIFDEQKLIANGKFSRQ